MSSSWIFISRQIRSGATFALYWKILVNSHHLVGLLYYLKPKLNPEVLTCPLRKRWLAVPQYHCQVTKLYTRKGHSLPTGGFKAKEQLWTHQSIDDVLGGEALRKEFDFFKRRAFLLFFWVMKTQWGHGYKGKQRKNIMRRLVSFQLGHTHPAVERQVQINTCTQALEGPGILFLSFQRSSHCQQSQEKQDWSKIW